MGARKRIAADKRKEAKRAVCTASLRNRPSSPRKMRLVADTIRGVDVNTAINTLTFTRRETSEDLLKLLKSAINNWEQKFESSPEESELYVKTITVDGGKILKRFQPRAMGRAYRIRKRSCHVNIELASRNGANLSKGEGLIENNDTDKTE
ncbi:MAG: 50S ribosomal protein L22 [Chitinophagales bacterium]|nr:50S ribosomal protein L22 [Chitinophagales bacterium]